MNSVKKVPIKQIERYLSFLNSLSDENLEKLENGVIVIKFEIVDKSKDNKSKAAPKLFHTEPLNYSAILADMFKFNSRQEGEEYLRIKCTNKGDYINLAKKLDLPFEKKDSIEKIKDKIVEATIGFRLRSQAINQGLSAKKETDE